MSVSIGQFRRVKINILTSISFLSRNLVTTFCGGHRRYLRNGADFDRDPLFATFLQYFGMLYQGEPKQVVPSANGGKYWAANIPMTYAFRP